MKNLSPTFQVVLNTVLAGISVSLGAYAYLQTQDVLGAVLFNIGLIAILHYKFTLYTGVVHHASDWVEGLCLVGILLFNILGCGIASLCVNDSFIVEQCQDIVTQRASLSFIQAVSKGIGCGFIITLAFQCWKLNIWTLLIGVPAFILAGFNHSITDAFYYFVGKEAVTWSAMLAFCGTVIGNFIGGSIYKLGTEEEK